MRQYEVYGCVRGFLFGICLVYPTVAKEVKNKNSYIKIYYEWEKIDKNHIDSSCPVQKNRVKMIIRGSN